MRTEELIRRDIEVRVLRETFHAAYAVVGLLTLPPADSVPIVAPDDGSHPTGIGDEEPAATRTDAQGR